jgi:hypothetical protein
MVQKIQNWRGFGRGVGAGVAAGLLCLAIMTASPAATEPQGKGQALEKPCQGQQVCPATPGNETCRIKVECPPIKASGKAACRTTVDCPGVKQPIKPKKTPKTE